MEKLLLLEPEEAERDKIRQIMKRYYPDVALIQEWSSMSAQKEKLTDAVDRELPDIVAVSLELPGGGGLNFLEYVREQYPWMKIILLSGYDSTQLMLHVWNKAGARILPKPVREMEFRKLFDEIREEAPGRQRSGPDRMLEEFGALYAVFMGDLEESDLEEYGEKAGLPASGFVLSIQLGSLYERGGRKKITSKNGLYRELKACLNGKRNGVICPVLANEIICYAEAGEEEEEERKAASELAGRLVVLLERKYHLRPRIGIGTVRPLSAISRSYEEARRALSEKPDERVAFFREMRAVKPEELEKELQMLESSVCLTVKAGKLEAMEHMSRYLECLDNVPLRCRKVRLLRLLGYADYIVQEYTDRLRECRISTDSLLEMLLDACWETAAKWAYWALFHILKMVRRGFRDQQFGLMAQVEEYLMESFHKEISLEDIAYVFGISPQYFSKTFKERTGQNYTDWLNRYRIDRAKELIRYTRMSIQEVGAQVGFPDSNYFSRTFKALEKESPTDYAKAYRDAHKKLL